MPSSVREMLAEANAAVPRLNPAETRDMIGKGNVLIVDVRDAPAVQRELSISKSQYYREHDHAVAALAVILVEGGVEQVGGRVQGDKTVLVYCASGGRSALSGKTLKDLGYQSVYNAGGFKELADAGLETEPA